MKLTKTCARFLRKNAGTLLAIGASVGVVLTAIETGKATIKAEKLVELNKDVPEYSMKEKVKDCWQFYIPAAVLGAGTIGCIIGSNMLSRKEIASLTAAYMALGKSYQQYRRQVAERVGGEEEKDILAAAQRKEEASPASSEKVLCYEPISKRYFHATETVSYTHLRAHETDSYLVCRLLLEKKKKHIKKKQFFINTKVKI